jgi:hypothetical protein
LTIDDSITIASGVENISLPKFVLNSFKLGFELLFDILTVSDN